MSVKQIDCPLFYPLNFLSFIADPILFLPKFIQPHLNAYDLPAANLWPKDK